MSASLRVRFEVDGQVHTVEAAQSLELGRQLPDDPDDKVFQLLPPREQEDESISDRLLVARRQEVNEYSTRHIRLEVMGKDQVRVTNLSENEMPKGSITADALSSGQSVLVTAPFTFRIAARIFFVDVIPDLKSEKVTETIAENDAERLRLARKALREALLRGELCELRDGGQIISPEHPIVVPPGKLNGGRESEHPQIIVPPGKLAGEDLPQQHLITDRVSFSLVAPGCIVQGHTIDLQFWAYPGTQHSEMERRARAAFGTDNLRVHTKSGIRVPRGTDLVVHLRLPGFTLIDPEESLFWEGELACAQFRITPPVDLASGSYPGEVTVHHAGIRIARVFVSLEVGPKLTPASDCTTSVVRHSSAFASYASEDRGDVIARVQGMKKIAPDLDIFVDVLSLRSGDRWAERLDAEIRRREVLYLFWSEPASRSVWVDREWRAALKYHGIDSIDPVPLASPDQVPPPSELARHLHFNDWLLAHIRTRQRIAES